ncbi:DUF2231 domain-containing protein [Rhizobium sp. Rhizsp82]|uniref:DUF2231 domain-containing protein n=1 Tax=Rhizobium sp. Rhizsp82 TaxID=3243057 RepID=UPI0039B683AB
MTYSTSGIPIRRYRASLRAIPLHFAAACFTGALITDIAYSQTAEMTWANFSAWLLTAGLLLGGLALLAGLVDLARGRFRFAGGAALLYVLGNIAVFVVSLFNAFIHSRDAWTSVVPTGLALSVVAFVLMILVAVCGSITERRIAGGY